MKQTLLVKLAPMSDQHAALLRTLEAFNAACKVIAGVAFAEHSADKIALQKLQAVSKLHRPAVAMARCHISTACYTGPNPMRWSLLTTGRRSAMNVCGGIPFIVL